MASLLDSAVATVNADQPANFSVSAGSNRKLLVFAAWNDGAEDKLTALSYGGEAMTQVMAVSVGNDTNHATVFELDDAGIEAAASTVFVPTYSPGSVNDYRTVFHVVSVSDADQDDISVTASSVTNADPMTVDIATVAGAIGLSMCWVSHGTGVGNSHEWENDWIELSEEDGQSGDTTGSLAYKAFSASDTDTAQCNPAADGSGSNSSIILAVRVDNVEFPSIDVELDYVPVTVTAYDWMVENQGVIQLDYVPVTVTPYDWTVNVSVELESDLILTINATSSQFAYVVADSGGGIDPGPSDRSVKTTVRVPVERTRRVIRAEKTRIRIRP